MKQTRRKLRVKARRRLRVSVINRSRFILGILVKEYRTINRTSKVPILKNGSIVYHTRLSNLSHQQRLRVYHGQISWLLRLLIGRPMVMRHRVSVSDIAHLHRETFNLPLLGPRGSNKGTGRTVYERLKGIEHDFLKVSKARFQAERKVPSFHHLHSGDEPEDYSSDYVSPWGHE